MLSFVWSIYLIVVISLSVLIFLQKGEDAVGMNQSKFMTPRAMSTLLTKLTYFLYGAFILLSLLIGIMIKKQKIALNKELGVEIDQLSVRDDIQQDSDADFDADAYAFEVNESDNGAKNDQVDDSSDQVSGDTQFYSEEADYRDLHRRRDSSQQDNNDVKDDVTQSEEQNKDEVVQNENGVAQDESDESRDESVGAETVQLIDQEQDSNLSEDSKK